MNNEVANNEMLEIEVRACFINSETGDIYETLPVSAVEKAHLFGVYTGKSDELMWCADFQELDHAKLFADALTKHLAEKGIQTINHGFR
ncbi:hypothetical protein D0C16_08545 [Cellvibrio sp. KY-GH-1]|uniref:hypothetical protein n=1 Tax=Cellvibrio sp. KY-GH-1 TaxID=2303332 RepID=UPI0012466B16|nr:hypothetical protein [Cellvibrio sp. KY-GH-1]QEY16022.1 hypothetical protein D0C16_08545 [Cellvibrio sp. KY-GH-1]